MKNLLCMLNVQENEAKKQCKKKKKERKKKN